MFCKTSFQEGVAHKLIRSRNVQGKAKGIIKLFNDHEF